MYLIIKIEVKLFTPLGIEGFVDNFALVVVFSKPEQQCFNSSSKSFIRSIYIIKIFYPFNLYH